MIYLQKMYQAILFKGKYKHVFLKSLVSFCLLRVLNLSICHTFYHSSPVSQVLWPQKV